MARSWSRAAALRVCAVFGCILVLPALFAAAARAAWPGGSNVDLPVCIAPGTQRAPEMAPDGAGGAILVWEDDRAGSWDLYAQRVDSAGVPRWTLNGVPVCAAAGDQQNAAIIPDGSGGAIVVWQDHRSPADWDVYAQRLGPDGTPRWAEDGVSLTAARGDQMYPCIAANDGHGAVVAWEDRRDTNSTDIYAQRVDGSGTVRWAANGIMVCGESNDQTDPQIAAAGAAGWIVTWLDARTSSDRPGIYAQRLSRAGVPLWVAGGRPVCTDASADSHPCVLADGAGGVVVAWDDGSIIAQRVDSSGTRIWAADGIVLCAGPALLPVAAACGDGSAIVGWVQVRPDENAGDIRAQRIGGEGTPRWPAAKVVRAAGRRQTRPAIVPDGAGGAIASWEDHRAELFGGIYAQRIDSTGALPWTMNGVALCTAPGQPYAPTLVSDGAGGAIVAWQDERDGAHIYAQHVDAAGRLGGTVHARGTTGAGTGVAPPPVPHHRAPRPEQRPKINGKKPS
jgi:hypothetical protein